MTDCRDPLETADIEALAEGSEPEVRADAADHAFRCSVCGERVRRAQGLEALLGAISADAVAPADLSDRVLRLRPFSRGERRSLAVWQSPLLLLGGLAATGTSLVAGLAGPREQVGFAAALLASGAGLLRASLRWAEDLSRTAPEGLTALSQLLAPTRAGWMAALLLLPAGLALSRVLSRSFARK